ncbi:hypothetical protein ACIPYQ_23565 [Streptomyces sp. NPDC090045]
MAEPNAFHQAETGAGMPVGQRAELKRRIAQQPGIERVRLHRVRG